MDELTVAVMAVLRQVEWVGGQVNERYCPCCAWYDYDGHADDCKLEALLDEGREGQREVSSKEQPSLMICPLCQEVNGICECPGGTIRWSLAGGGAEDVGDTEGLLTTDVRPTYASEALAVMFATGQGALMLADLCELFNLLGVSEDVGVHVCDPLDPDQRFVIRRVGPTEGETGDGEASEQDQD